MRPFPKTPIRKVHPLAWLWEPMEEDATFFLRSMFGSKAVYLDGKVMLYFSSKAEPFRGMFVCTEKKHHKSLMAEFPVLAPHRRLKKWLYMSESSGNFEKTAETLVRLALFRDPRIGVFPPRKKRKRAFDPPGKA